jgi:hypothetical protein
LVESERHPVKGEVIMLTPLIESLVDARITEDRERASLYLRAKPSKPHSAVLWNRHNRGSGHATHAPGFGRLATTDRC